MNNNDDNNNNNNNNNNNDNHNHNNRKKNLGMPCKVFQQPNNCLRENDSLQFIEKNADTFKDFCSNLATDLVNQLSATENIFGMSSVKECYSALNI